MNAEHLEPISGVEVQVHQTAQALAARGHVIDLVHIHRGSLYDSYREVCASMTQIPAFDFLPRHPVRSFRRIAPAIRAGGAEEHDVIYANRYLSLMWARAVGAKTSTPVVCHVHGMTGAWHPTFNRAISHGTRRIIAVSDYIRREFISRGAPDRVLRVVHNGIDPQAYPPGGLEERRAARTALGLPQDAYIVLQFGRLHPDKGTELLADAASAAAVSTPNLHLLYCGQPYEPGYPDVLRQRVGGVPSLCLESRHDVVTPLHAADLVVVPTLSPEPFGRVVIEALATGRPVVGSASGGIPEILGDAFPDQLFASGDSQALAALIGRFATWRQDTPDLAERSIRHVETKFTLARMIDSVENELIQARSGRLGSGPLNTLRRR